MNSDIGKRIVFYFANLFDWRENIRYITGVSCSVIAVILIYKWQVWYSSDK